MIYPDDNLIKELYARAGTPEPVIRHMQAVADFQNQLLDKLEAAGLSFIISSSLST